jgi:hypothetical protein
MAPEWHVTAAAPPHEESMDGTRETGKKTEKSVARLDPGEEELSLLTCPPDALIAQTLGEPLATPQVCRTNETMVYAVLTSSLTP